MTDLLKATARLVDVASVSHSEAAIADVVEAQLREHGGDVVEVIRIGDNLCGRTRLGLPQRVLLAGHLDTVPANGNAAARVDGDVLYGVGSADMKAGVAVFLELCRQVALSPGQLGCDVSWIFYVCEEVERRHSGLLQIESAAPDLLTADAAVLGEPTDGRIEAGCQGVLKATVTVKGLRAHTARPWMGVNAIQRLAPVLSTLGEYEGRRPVIDGCEFREALQAVGIQGGVAANVVPDTAEVLVNHRFAPDRNGTEAFAALRALLAPVLSEGDGDSVTLGEIAKPAPPGLGHPLLSALLERTGRAPRAKLGWTDVSFFAEHGVPATNFGPGDPEVAHTAQECVSRASLDLTLSALSGVLFRPAG